MPRHTERDTADYLHVEHDAPIVVLAAAFRDELAAVGALEGLGNGLKPEREGRFATVRSAVLLRKDAIGKLHIKESMDLDVAHGAVIGGVIGAAIGVISGGALAAPMAVGALIGGLAARLRRTAFPIERFVRLGKELRAGESAIVATVDRSSLGHVEMQLAEAGTNAFSEELDADIAAQLEAGHEVAYDTLVTREGLVLGRIAGYGDGVGGGMLVPDDSGLTASQFIATETGFAVLAIDITNDGSATSAVGLAIDVHPVVDHKK